MTSDFFVPLRTIEAGLDVVVDPDARGYLSSGDPDREFERKVRTLVNGFHVLFCHWHLLNPFAHRVAAWELVSRKLFRWLLPIAFFALLLSNCMLAISSTLFRWALASQFVVYATGTLALLANPVRKILPFKLAGFFVMGNAATVTAWWKFLGGERYVSWKPTRRQAVADGDAMRATDH